MFREPEARILPAPSKVKSAVKGKGAIEAVS
jgi:hypothetical protein